MAVKAAAQDPCIINDAPDVFVVTAGLAVGFVGVEPMSVGLGIAVGPTPPGDPVMPVGVIVLPVTDELELMVPDNDPLVVGDPVPDIPGTKLGTIECEEATGGPVKTGGLVVGAKAPVATL